MKLYRFNSSELVGSILGALLILSHASLVQAQFIYLSDSRSISVAGRLTSYDPNSSIVDYSGNYSLTTNPASSFASFLAYLNGSASGTYSNVFSQSPVNCSTRAGQTSYFTPAEIYCAANVSAFSYGPPGVELGDAYSEFRVSFSVGSNAEYNMTCTPPFNWSPMDIDLHWSLSSLNQGTLISQNGPDGVHAVFAYTGVLTAGDVYTLQVGAHHPIISFGGPYADGGGVAVDFTVVPEPSTMVLVGVAIVGIIILEKQRLWRTG